MVIIDAHHHLWFYQENEYPWINKKMGKLRRNYLPEEFRTEITRNKVNGTVVIEARQFLKETRWLIDIGQKYSFIRGIVGWVDLCKDGVEKDLEYFSQYNKFKGVRHVLEDEIDDRFMLRKSFLRGIALLKKYHLTYDFLIKPRHLVHARELVARFSEQPFVIDHLAKPNIREGKIQDWKKALLEVAQADNVYCKASGMVTEVDRNHRKIQYLGPI